MNKDELIEWVLNLPLQTLTDELKDDISKLGVREIRTSLINIRKLLN